MSEIAPFDMAALLSQIVDAMLVKAQEKGISLTLRYDAKVARTFIGDSGYIRQIVMNLVSNAIKFTNVGAVTLSFGTGEKPNEISISVADTGIGISQNKLSIIFDRYTQADPSIGQKYGGTGLGLSISKALAEDMGGVITVKSVAGMGSTFVLHLCLPDNTGNDDSKIAPENNAIYLDEASTLQTYP